MKFDHYNIRQLTAGDLAPYFNMVERNRKQLEDFFTGTVSRTRTLEDTTDFLAEMVERAKNRTYMPYVIVDELSGQFAGFLDLKNIDWSIPKAETGCYIDTSLAGKGAGTRAFQLFCTYCFETLGFRKLFLRTHESNTAAKRLAERCGFEREGVLRHDYKTTSGLLVDLVYYGRLNDPASSRTVSFEDYYSGKLLSDQEALLQENYTKVFSIDGAVKKKEEYTKKKLDNIVFYKSVGEDDLPVINSIRSEYGAVSFVLVEREMSGSYRIETGRAFTPDGIYDDYHYIMLFDAANQLIFEKIVNLFNGQQETDLRKYCK
ncbi:MAG: GNAT family protein, partial [Chitinophagaceae bacterium]